MIKQLVLDNFLAHEHTEIEFSEGVTVLTGPNNSGKSAVVEGLRCLASNPAPKFFIRHGAKEARVEALFDTGERVAWIRRRTHALYEVRVPGEEEPRIYAKFGRRPPQDVLDILRLNMVDIESGDPVDVHIGDQRKPVFLLDQSGFTTASFFASSSESAYLLSMQRLLKSRIQDAKREKKGVESRLAGLAVELDALSGLPKLALECETLRNRCRAVEASGQALPVLEEVLERAGRLKRSERRAAARLHVLARTASPPDLYPSRLLADRLRAMRELHRAGLRAQRRKAVLAVLAAAPVLFPAISLDRLVTRIAGARKNGAALLKHAEILKTLASPPELHPVAALCRTMDRRQELGQAADREKRRKERFDAVLPPPELEDLSRLAAVAAELGRMTARAAAAKRKMDEAAERLAARKRTMDARLAEIGSCPLCGNELSAEVFAEEGCCS